MFARTFFAEIEGELDDVEELHEYVGGVGAVGTLHNSGKDIVGCQSSMLLKLEPSAVLRMASVTSVLAFVVMALATPSFAPITT